MPVQRDGSDLVIDVRVQPRAARSEVAGWRDGRLRIRLQAPPVDGRANAALVELLADALGIARARVTIEHGLGGRSKRVRIHGAESIADAARALLEPG